MEARGRIRWWWAAAAVLVVAETLLHWVRGNGWDLLAYHAAARSVLHLREAPLYRPSGPDVLHPFTYPPFAALVFIPLAVGRFVAWRYVVDALLAVALALLGWASLRAVGVRGGPRWSALLAVLAVASLALRPVYDDFRFGQISLVLVLMIVTDLCGVVPPRWRGLLTGLAAAIKLTPLVLLPFLALTRQWRALLLATGGFAAATVVGFLVLPQESRQYWTGYLRQTDRIGDPARLENQSLRGVLLRLGLPAHGPGPDPVWLLVAAIVGVATILVAAAWWRRGERLLGLSLAALVGLFLSPISWYHHWCWVVPLVVALARLSRVVAALTVVPFLAAARIAVALGCRGSTHHWDPVQQVVGNAYVWTGLLVVGYAGWRLWRDRMRRGEGWTPERAEPLLHLGSTHDHLP